MLRPEKITRQQLDRREACREQRDGRQTNEGPGVAAQNYKHRDQQAK